MKVKTQVPIDRLAGWLLVVVGAALVVVGAAQVSGADYLADQMSYLASAGIGGLTSVAVGGMLLLRSNLRDVWEKLDGIEDVLRPGDPNGIPAEVTIPPDTTHPVLEPDLPSPTGAVR